MNSRTPHICAGPLVVALSGIVGSGPVAGQVEIERLASALPRLPATWPATGSYPPRVDWGERLDLE